MLVFSIRITVDITNQITILTSNNFGHTSSYRHIPQPLKARSDIHAQGSESSNAPPATSYKVHNTTPFPHRSPRPEQPLTRRVCGWYMYDDAPKLPLNREQRNNYRDAQWFDARADANRARSAAHPWQAAIKGIIAEKAVVVINGNWMYIRIRKGRTSEGTAFAIKITCAKHQRKTSFTPDLHEDDQATIASEIATRSPSHWQRLVRGIVFGFRLACSPILTLMLRGPGLLLIRPACRAWVKSGFREKAEELMGGEVQFA